MMAGRMIGQPLPRVEATAKVSGQYQYAADVVRAGTLWGKVLRSPVPHARIVSINVDKALGLAGVKALITAKDVSPTLVGATLKDMPLLAQDKVRYVGEEIVALAAVDREVAEEAIGLIDVEYETLPAVYDPLAAMEPDAPLLHPDYASYQGPPTKVPQLRNVQTLVRAAKGDIARGFAAADHIFENTFRTQLVHQGYIEPHACTVEVDGAGRVAVWVANQSVFKLRRELAAYLGLPENAITIYPSNMGGSFGAKDFLTHAPAAYYLSRATGKPVKFVKSYSEELTASSPRHPAVIRLRTGVMKDGTLCAWEGRTYYNGGAYGAYKPNSEGSMSGAYMVAGSYNIPHTLMEGYCVYTNQVPGGYCRAPGETQTLFAVESHMDMMAHALRIDPLEFRLRNALKDGDTRSTGEPLRDARGVDVLRRLGEVSQWGHSQKRVRGRNDHKFGRGIAFGDRHVGHGESSFELCLERNGVLRLVSGVGDQGVGAYIMHRQVVAETFGVDPDGVLIEVRDTSNAPYDQGIKGARGMHIEGQAIVAAGRALKERLCTLAAAYWKTEPECVSWSDGSVILEESPGERLSLKELANLSEEPIIGFGRYVGHKPDVYSFQAVVADVEVDQDTGAVEVDHLYFVYDVANIVNPLIHQGQIDGGVVQGLGYALTEEILLDDGKPTTVSLGDYKLPTMRDFPPLTTALVHGAEGPGPFGTKAVAEAGISIIAPAIANAVYDATGARMAELPVTAEKVFEGLMKCSVQI